MANKYIQIGGIYMYTNNIKLYREKLYLTISQLSEISGVSCGYICHLEKGSRKNPSIPIMEKIAKALNHTVAEVFFN